MSSLCDASVCHWGSACARSISADNTARRYCEWGPYGSDVPLDNSRARDLVFTSILCCASARQFPRVGSRSHLATTDHAQTAQPVNCAKLDFSCLRTRVYTLESACIRPPEVLCSLFGNFTFQNLRQRSVYPVNCTTPSWTPN